MSTDEKQFDDSIRKKISNYQEETPVELWGKIAAESGNANGFNFFKNQFI